MLRGSRAPRTSWTNVYGPLLEPLGITYPQYVTLLVLWETDAISVKQLGERLSLDSATLTPLLKRLELHKLVERRRDSRDERVVRIHLTDKGRALRGKAKQLPAAMACRAGFDSGDKDAMTRIGHLRDELEALVRNLEGGD